VNLELLRAVSNTPGLSGFEDEVQKVALASLRESCEQAWRDRLGNVIGLRSAADPLLEDGRPRRVVLAAHADEIGMLVKHVDERGYIRFHPVGGLHAPSLIAQPVVIHGREPVRGAVVPNTFEPRRIPELADLLIDVARPREEIVRLIEVGDPITLAHEVTRLNDDVYMGRNFDDRIGTYCLLEAMRRVGDTRVDVYAVSTVQEEVGVRGMPVAAYALEPDIGIALDGSLTQHAYATPHQWTCELGGGAGVYVIDNLTIGDRRLVAFLLGLGAEHGIPVQKDIGGGTDASALQRVRHGALATTIGAPVRYMHSTVQLCHDADVEATVRLLTTFLEHAHELPLSPDWAEEAAAPAAGDGRA
jgi:endoglucanase